MNGDKDEESDPSNVNNDKLKLLGREAFQQQLRNLNTWISIDF